MRSILIPLACLTAAVLLPIGSASATVAYPVENATLTDNPLYAAGSLPVTECPEKPIKKLNVSSAKNYLNGVLACLNHTWAVQLENTGQSFSKPKVAFATKAPKKFCGEKWLKGWSSHYCIDSRTILIVLERNLLEEPDDLYLFNLLAMHYGGHVQNVVGIYRAYEKIPYRNKAELAEQRRRYNLQSNCFSGVFIASVWDSLDRTQEDWDDLLVYTREWASTINGTRKTINYWTSRGFKSADLSSCNTWSAASSKVA